MSAYQYLKMGFWFGIGMLLSAGTVSLLKAVLAAFLYR